MLACIYVQTNDADVSIIRNALELKLPRKYIMFAHFTNEYISGRCSSICYLFTVD